MHSDYVPLHLHTQHSLLDGAIRVEELIIKAQEYKLPAIAITDHGNLFGAVNFYKTVSKAGIKPIIGCEVYVAPKSRFDRGLNGISEASFHLILLCKDTHGYKNLMTLVSKAYLEGFYYRPRIDKDLLTQYSGGLIGLSSCLKGEIPYLLSKGMLDEAREAALSYKRILGAENFYLEIQANGLPEQEKVNSQLIALGRELHIGLVATNDCHYLNREDAKAHDILLCIQTGKTLKDTDRMKFTGEGFYFKSPEEMKTAFKDIPEAIENTKKIAERCNLDIKFSEFHLPKYELNDSNYSNDLNGYLRKVAEDGLEKKLIEDSPWRKGQIPEQYIERLNSELKMIETMGFSSYFLIVWDFIRYAKAKGVPVGPGRGSAAGSLVAYCLDITEIDPIKYGLLFERFLNPERISMPDIDVDFCMDRRPEVIEYVAERYGKDRVAQIITFGTMQARAAIRDAGRAMDIPYAEVDRVAKLIPNIPGITLKDALTIDSPLKELYEENSKIREMIDIAQRLEGLTRHASTHAAGIVISPEPLTEFSPLYKAPNDAVITTQYEMAAIESLGLLKFDFLGLKTLTVIDKTEKHANKTSKTTLHEDFEPFRTKNIPLNDRETFDLLSSGRTTGIFQLESSGMRELLVRLRPEAFEDLIALVALYRPGPLGSGMVEDFIKRKRGHIPIKYALPQLEEILQETYGVILYQEQVMRIANKLANFTMGQADILRKAMGKKMPEEMEKLKKTFIQGAKNNKIPEKKAEKIFDLMAFFAEYGFNKSHSAAYALIAYQTAYLKTHLPVEFMAALLSSDMDNTSKVVTYINDCKEMGIKILPPDINESEREFKVMGNSIRFGLEAVKGVGGSAIEAIIEARTAGTFTSFMNFCTKVDSRRVNKKVIESLIKAGAFDSTGRRSQLMAALDSTLDSAAKAQKAKNSGQGIIFETQHTGGETLPDIEEWERSELLRMEKEAIGFYITGHPLDKYKEKLEQSSVTPSCDLQELQDKEEVTLGGIIIRVKQIQSKKRDIMAYLTVEDLYGITEVIVFPDLYRESSGIISEDTPIIISGQIDKTDKGLKVIAKKISSLESSMLRPRPILARRSGAGSPMESGDRQKTEIKKLTLTLTTDTNTENLIRLKEIILRYSGNCPVYLRITSPNHWETIASTALGVAPSKEMVMEVENLMGKGTVVVS
ncbi:MAG: DNA polymerase III subunit alpha [Nitrospirae bacterium]|nr:DNA polymerase III subunit alpha [Nitrospirota bacterium]